MMGENGLDCEDLYCFENNEDFIHNYRDYSDYESESLITNVLSYFSYAFFGLFILLNATFLSSLLISYSFSRGLNSIKDDEETTDDEEEDYEYKYVNEFEALVENSEAEEKIVLTDEDKTKLLDVVLMETTPNGDVVMSYEYDKEVPDRSKFVYYSNSKTVPYKYLDTVARKYVYVNKCPEIYVYIKDELMKANKKIEEYKKREEERNSTENSQTVQSKNDIFATFKNYKRPNSTSTTKRRHILVAKNKYKYLGTIEDYNNSLSQAENKERETKAISFSAFKQMRVYS